MGCVYFIKHIGVDGVKIGCTKEDNPSKRLRSFNTYSPNGVELIDYFKCKNYNEVEEKIHAKYKSYRMNGEFFDISGKYIDYIIKTYSIHEVLTNDGVVLFSGNNNCCIKFLKNKGYKKEFHPFFDDNYYNNGIDYLTIERSINV